MKRLSRIVLVDNTIFHKSFQYINYALSTNALTVRLLRNTTKSETTDLSEDNLYSTKQIFANSYVQSVGLTIPYKGKTLEVIAEATLDYDKFPKEAKQPLSNILIFLANNELKVESYQLHTNLTHYRSSDYLRSLPGTAMCLAQIYFVNADDLISDCSISLTQLNDVDIISDIDFKDWVYEDSKTAADRNTPKRRFQPRLVITPLSETVEEDGIVSYRVTCELNDKLCTDANFIVHIEPVDGYVAHKRVQLINGKATFDAIALNLKDGETMRIKVNLPHYTGLAECTVKVVAKPKEEVPVKTQEELILEMQAAVLSADQIKQDIKAYSENLINSSISKTLNEFSALKESTEVSLADTTKSISEFIIDQNTKISELQESYRTALESAKKDLKAESKKLLEELADVRDTLIDTINKLESGQKINKEDLM